MHLVYLAGSGGNTQDFKWREIEWGQKLKPKRIPAPKINPQKIPSRISEPLEFPEGIKWYNTKAKNIRKWMFVPLFLRQNLKLSFAGTNLQIVLNTKKIPT